MLARRISLAALLVTVVACARSGTDVRRGDAAGGLEGFWTAELRLEEPARLRGDTVVKPVRGRLALLDNGALGRPTRRPLHFGAYTVNVAPFGIVLGSGDRVPTVEAWRPSADSVELTLDPAAPGGGVRMAGRLWADSVAGKWRWEGAGRGTSAAGRFVLRREGQTN
ncbi:MAG TPA: hypothetical protein VFS20_28800 [Longimicrobium sp.]|nr:hypothetical protein [Longimicrobium sp.]